MEIQVSNQTNVLNFKIFENNFLAVNEITDDEFSRFKHSFYGVEDEWYFSALNFYLIKEIEINDNQSGFFQ